MGLIDYLKTQFLEIIEWQDDSRDTLSFRYPATDQEKRCSSTAAAVRTSASSHSPCPRCFLKNSFMVVEKSLRAPAARHFRR